MSATFGKFFVSRIVPCTAAYLGANHVVNKDQASIMDEMMCNGGFADKFSEIEIEEEKKYENLCSKLDSIESKVSRLEK